MMELFDKDKDGKVSQIEFVRWTQDKAISLETMSKELEHVRTTFKKEDEDAKAVAAERQKAADEAAVAQKAAEEAAAALKAAEDAAVAALCEEYFNLIDTDKSGHAEEAEVRRMLGAVTGMPEDFVDTDDMMELFDKDKDGKVSQIEFVRWTQDKAISLETLSKEIAQVREKFAKPNDIPVDTFEDFQSDDEFEDFDDSEFEEAHDSNFLDFQ